MSKINRIYLIVILVLYQFTIFSSCTKNMDPIKIGLSINLSGVGGTAGEHIRNGAMLAVEKINNDGGIKGRPLKLLVRDDENSDEGIRKADESLINEKVVAIIGHSHSSNTIKAYPYVSSKNTLLITAYASTQVLSGKDDLFLRTSADCELSGIKMSSLLNKENINSVSILMDMTNPGFVVDYVESIKKHFNGQIKQVQFESRQNADWNQIIENLLLHTPEAIILITEATMTGVALQKITNQDFQGKLIATIWAQSPELIRIAGQAAEGLSIITYINPSIEGMKYLEFSQQMESKFGKPANARSARAYELTNIIAEGLNKCENINTIELKNSLLNLQFETILGSVKFDKFGDIDRPIFEVVVKNGTFIKKAEIK